MQSSLFRISHPKDEGILNVSKWLKIQVLLDLEEMTDFLESLGDLYLVITSEPLELKDAEVSKSAFLNAYGNYIEDLLSGYEDIQKKYRKLFSCILTSDKELLYAMSVDGDRYLIKTIKPVVQLQLHQFFVSSIDHSFNAMVLGKESIHWGLQISYPQIYQDPKTQLVEKVTNSSDFAIRVLFSTISKWVRDNTQPTPFEVLGKKTYVPIRIGKKCLKWIDKHPQLIARGLNVIKSSEVL